MEIKFKNKIIEWLNLPSIPRKKWDGKTSFKTGVAIVSVGDELAYVVATYDAERDQSPRIIKTFSTTMFSNIIDIYPVPSYMDEDIESFDMDDQSKAAAKMLLNEAHELELEGVEEKIDIPDNEYCYSHITNDEQAQAFIKDWNKRHGIKKSRVPTTHESIVLKLTAMWADDNKPSNKRNKKS